MKANCIATKQLTLNITRCDLSKERPQKWHQFKPGEVLFFVLFIQNICWRAPRHKMKQHHITSPKRRNLPIATFQSTNMVTLRKAHFLRRYTSSDGRFCHCHVCVGGCRTLNPAAGCWKRPASTNIEWHFIQVWGKTLRSWKKMVVDWLTYYILY